MTAPDERSRPPAGNGRAANISDHNNHRVADPGRTADELTARARSHWAYRMVERCASPPPAYGSREWLQLPEDDVRRIAAVVVAAEAWASAGDCLEETLRAEVEAERVAFKRAEDDDYIARRDAHADWWSGGRHDPTVEGDRIEREFREWLTGGEAA